jgi:REP element-mobilizing transposase RayT
MKLFKSHEPNTLHYVTAVCFKRTPVFRSERACELFVEALAETRRRNPFKLIGYVLMPHHAHLIMNPLSRDIGLLMGRIKSTSARSILDWLRESSHLCSLKKLALDIPQKKGHTGSVPIEMDWRGYWRHEEFGSFVETARNARL